MKWKGGPRAALFQAKLGVENPYENTMAIDPQGSYRYVQEMEKTVNPAQRGQALYEIADWVRNKGLNIRQATTSDEATEARAGMVNPIDAPPGLLGYYNPQSGDATFSRTGALGTGVLAGTGTDYDVYGQGNQRNLYNEFSPDFQPWLKIKNGGMVLAQMGLQVGDELDLTEEDIAEMQRFGFHVTRI